MNCAATHNLSYSVNLDAQLKKTYLNDIFATDDCCAHRYNFTLYKDKAKAQLSAGATVKGYFIRYKDNTTVLIEGELDGSTASVTLNKPCYTQSGQFALVVKLMEDDVISTIFYGEGSVAIADTGSYVDPDDIIPSLDDLLAQIAAMEAATALAQAAGKEAKATAQEAANTALQAAENADVARLAIQDDLSSLKDTTDRYFDAKYVFEEPYEINAYVYAAATTGQNIMVASAQTTGGETIRIYKNDVKATIAPDNLTSLRLRIYEVDEQGAVINRNEISDKIVLTDGTKEIRVYITLTHDELPEQYEEKFLVTCLILLGDVYLNEIVKIKEEEPDIFSVDLYPYKEVLTEGYLPNPDRGIMEEVWISDTQNKEMVNHCFENTSTFGSIYGRYTWDSVYQDGAYNFAGIGEQIEAAIDSGCRAQIGVFFNVCPGTNGNYIEEENRFIYYSFPEHLFASAYGATEYPLRLINYGYAKDGKPVYNAVIDWRNDTLRTEYDYALESFSKYLDDNVYNGIRYRDAVSGLQIRFWGKWGEGHNDELIDQFSDIEDSETLISVVNMYINHFDDIRLIAPVDGKMRSYFNAGLFDWQNYYFSAENSVGLFGFFNDHIGSSLTHTVVNTDYNGVNMLQLILERYREAPMVGEDYNSGEYKKFYPPLVFLLNDSNAVHFSMIKWSNMTGVGKTPAYGYPSVKESFKRAYDAIGYRIYYIPVCAYIENGTIYAKLLLGNIGLTKVYETYWQMDIVVRNAAGEVIDTITDIFDLTLIEPSSKALQPSWKECVQCDVTAPCKPDVDYSSCIFTLRCRDTVGISNNMFFSNTGRDANGEYPLF